MLGTILGVIIIVMLCFPVSCFLWSVFAREVPLEGDAVPAVVPCASIGRSVGLRGGLCVCVSLCAGTWIFGWIRLFGGIGRWPAPLSIPPLTGPWPLWPGLGVLCLGVLCMGRCCVVLCLLAVAFARDALRGLLRALGALRARLAAVVLVGFFVRPPLGFWPC